MKYGRQFDVCSYTTVLPATEQGIRRYLGSGLIKGIGPVMAERMVNHFGAGIMHIIDDEPGRLIEVPGLGPKRSTRIKDAWAEQKAIKQVMIFLQGVGVSTSLAVKIYKKYGDESEQTVQQQPYKLASDVWGIGFKTADTIAASVGIAKDSPERIKAGLAYTLCRQPGRQATRSSRSNELRADRSGGRNLRQNGARVPCHLMDHAWRRPCARSASLTASM